MKPFILTIFFFVLGLCLSSTLFDKYIHRYKVGDCAKSTRAVERWESPNGYDIFRIMEIGTEQYRYCYPLVDTEARCNLTLNPRLSSPSLGFSIIDNTTDKVECPPFAK